LEKQEGSEVKWSEE